MSNNYVLVIPSFTCVQVPSKFMHIFVFLSGLAVHLGEKTCCPYLFELCSLSKFQTFGIMSNNNFTTMTNLSNNKLKGSLYLYMGKDKHEVVPCMMHDVCSLSLKPLKYENFQRYISDEELMEIYIKKNV